MKELWELVAKFVEGCGCEGDGLRFSWSRIKIRAIKLGFLLIWEAVIM